MPSWRFLSTLLFSLLLQLLCFSTLATARDKSKVEVIVKEFDGAAANLHYFEDSDVVLIHDRTAGHIFRSNDAGKSWDPIDGVEKGAALELWPHPYDPKVAYILGGRKDHWVTKDRGESWRKFDTKDRPTLFRPPFTFHAGDSDKVLYHGQECENMLECEDVSYYTMDAFKTKARMRENTRGCTYAHATPLFEASNDDTVICVVKGKYSGWPEDNRLLVSNNYFKDEVEPYLEGERTVQGIINIAPIKGFIVAAAKAKGTTELALYVTKDAQIWHRAMFPSDHKIEEDAYTILESTNYSIQVDVMTTKPTEAMGVLCTSNSNGTYFTQNIQHTNRNFHGIVDFERIQGIQGIVLVNIVDNWVEVEKSRKNKKLVTRISFDDGREFKSLKAGTKDLHLHSVTDMVNIGRVYSSPAPGLVMGVGNTGEHLKRYKDCDTWVSDDAGATWKLALKEAHKYEFGDQGAVLVAVYDEGPTDEVKYSIDHGKTWESVDLGMKVKAHILTTTPDSTSLKFLFLATTGSGEEVKHYSFFLDFAGVLDKTCKDDDMEEWYARVDEDGKPRCLMGHKQYYNRRKAEAKCFIDHEFKEAKPQSKPCACTEEDYECDFNFIRSEDRKSCEPAGSFRLPHGVCRDDEETYMGPSGFRLVPGDNCIRNEGVELDKDIERSCNQTKKTPASGQITHEISSFKASNFQDWYYLERTASSSGDDETVIMRTDEKKVYMSKDHGKTWDHILKGKEITAIYPHQYINDVIYFLTGSQKAWYSIHRGDNIREFKTPAEPSHDKVQTMAFHPDYKDWIIWTGAQDCGSKGECHSVAHKSEDRGAHWDILLRYVRKCEFIQKEGRGASEKLVYCEQFKDEMLDGPLELLSSDNWFADAEPKFSNVIDFATMAEFIVVAAKNQQDEKSLSVAASIDGKTFAAAEFPSNFNVPVQRAYTVLDSSTHAVFLHVTVGSRRDSEYGTIIKSNSNGTSYVLSIEGVNRNTAGYVDFEKMLGLEGVALVNVVDNVEDAERGDSKKLKTMITHNDGAKWAPVQAPSKDTEGHNFKCEVGNVAQCSLHLHGYTERLDPRATYSSPSAVGLMMGVGNVGEYLGRKGDDDTYTFLTRDGGVEWKAVKKGAYMWEYGDQGSIIVIVEDKKATNVVFYTLDEGATWTQYQFTDSKMEISALTTVPSDTSPNFLLWGRDVESASEIATVNLDFTGLWDRQCELNDKHPEESEDYELWEPKHPLSEDNCLFGHIAQYHRKKISAHCFNGRRYESLHNIKQNCSCTREDFEW